MTMDDDVLAYVAEIPATHRPLFDRFHGLVVGTFPEAATVMSYRMPTYRVGDRRLYVGVWRHGLSLYGWDAERNADFVRAHPGWVTSKGTIRLTAARSAELSDDDLVALIRRALAP